MLKNIGKYLSVIKLRYIIISVIAAYVFSLISHQIYVIMGGGLYSPIIAPILEEPQKLLFLLINFNFGMTYTLVLSLLEFNDYLIEGYLHYDYIPSHYAIIRVLVIMMHISCFLIMNKGVKLYRKTKEKLYIVVFLICSMLLHMIWNTFLGDAVYKFILLFY